MGRCAIELYDAALSDADYFSEDLEKVSNADAAFKDFIGVFWIQKTYKI